MTRRCSHCSNNGHNSRTCPNRGVKLFGVRLTDGSIRKSASMGNLTHYAGSGSGSLPNNPASPGEAVPDRGAAADGYASEDFVPGTSSSSSCRERKKGVPWTEEEHRMFLLGLQKLGKGDWRGISRSFVISRTPTQVASHAQKYFIRQTCMSRRKRRSSLFDMVADEASDMPMESQDFLSVNPSKPEAESNDHLPAPPLPPAPEEEEEYESMESSNSNEGGDSAPPAPKPELTQTSYPVIYPAAAYFSPIIPITFPLWHGCTTELVKSEEAHEVVKPTAVHSKTIPINVDELIGISKLSLGEPIGKPGPSPLSLKLDGSSRQSAFHANTGSGGTNSSSPLQAV
ncbi:hypothetical protein SAY87_030898 [Trapa incisa]|uniref:Uncharacterized protein n=1 Tax=Trapa incisa TaxID=236973 RepID=A0AAN7KNB9_9MYRT|nr:hypothetical protein SAY87_030898 [Trapa incisa]